MRVYLTGATGFIGSRILPELLARGHQVIGMTRSDQGAEALTSAGAIPHLATLEDADAVARGAQQADAVIHTAFDHNFETFVANCEKDARVIAALGQVLKGSDRPMIVTSGTGMGTPEDGGPALESIFNTDHPNPRIATELAAGRLLDAGVNVRVMRLPQVHDTRRQGLISPYIQIARDKGRIAYAGDGQTRWPAAHVSDVAALYAMAFDQGAPGTRYHAVAEEGITTRRIAEVLADKLNLPVASLAPDELQDHFGWFAAFASLDMPASSDWTRAQLDWSPKGPDLLTDLRGLKLDS